MNSSNILIRQKSLYIRLQLCWVSVPAYTITMDIIVITVVVVVVIVVALSMAGEIKTFIVRLMPSRDKNENTFVIDVQQNVPSSISRFTKARSNQDHGDSFRFG